jgi:hypothetical protein
MLSGQGPVIVSRLDIEGSDGTVPAGTEQDLTREIEVVVNMLARCHSLFTFTLDKRSPTALADGLAAVTITSE